MQIKNNTDRALEVQVAGRSSQTLWTASIPAGSFAGKDLPDSDKPYTATGRWAAEPPLKYNWLYGTGVGSIPDNNVTIVVQDAYPCFRSDKG